MGSDIHLSLPIEFLSRSAVEVAHDLIGCILHKRNIDGSIYSQPILETEAYLNEQDLASHARFGKTQRTAPMFQEAGYWYVYLCYGLYWMLNLVVDHRDFPSAVLIRAINNFKGPGKLTKALQIDGTYNNTLCNSHNGLWIELPTLPLSLRICTTPRIGVDYAGPMWAQKPFRFVGEMVK